jgi:hypothetical protein
MHRPGWDRVTFEAALTSKFDFNASARRRNGKRLSRRMCHRTGSRSPLNAP